MFEADGGDDEHVHISADGDLRELIQNRIDIKESYAKTRYTTDKDDVFSEYEDDDDVASERNTPYGAANASDRNLYPAVN